jgi:DNA-binding IclR family transcriptional regulator
MFGSCSGACWLAAQSEATVLKTIRLCRVELGALAHNVEGIKQSLDRVREQGFAYGGLYADRGLEGVAVALPPAANDVVLVLVASNLTAEIVRNKAIYASAIRRKIADLIGPA